MIEKLIVNFGFSMSACKLISSYLHGRYQFVCVNNIKSNLLQLHSGVPQGCVLGPILFILYINDLPGLINSTSCKSFLYADDVALLFSSNRDFPDVLENNINYTLSVVSDWAFLNSMSLNGEKTKAIVFNPFDRFAVDLDIFIDGVRVEFLNRVRCLGVILDSKLNFEAHIDQTFCRVLQTLRKIHSTNVFYPHHVIYRLAYSLLMSQVFYGLEVISGTVSTNLSRLNRIVNTIVRFVYNVRRRDHISLYVERFLGCSFPNFLKLRCLIHFYRAMGTGFPLPLLNGFTFSRSIRNPQIVIPRIINTFYERSFLIRVARVWNYLPLELRIFSHSNNAFRKKLLNFYSNE